jgi:hypothetical protein
MTGRCVLVGFLPVPDEVRVMHSKIDQLTEVVNAQTRLLEKLLVRSGETNGSNGSLTGVEKRLGHIDDSLTMIKDCVRFK